MAPRAVRSVQADMMWSFCAYYGLAIVRAAYVLLIVPRLITKGSSFECVWAVCKQHPFREACGTNLSYLALRNQPTILWSNTIMRLGRRFCSIRS